MDQRHVRSARKDRPVHRRRQPLRDRKVAWLRHRLQAACCRNFRRKGYLLRAYYYTALAEDQEYSSIRPLIDWLDYNGYTVVTKPTKEFVDASGRRKIKGNMDIELAVDVMEMAESIDHLVLFSGDGDFRSLVEAVQRKGRKVSVDLDAVDPAADDRRRAAPPGRPFRRSC